MTVGREARVTPELAQLVEIHQALITLGNSMGDLTQFFKAPAPDAVLMSETVVLDGTGVYTASWPIIYASVAVASLGGAVTVSNSGLQADVPDTGPGVFVVPAGGFASHNLRGQILSLYGTPGAAVDVTVFVRPQPPVVAQAAASSGIANNVTFTDGVQTAVSNVPVLILAASSTRRVATIVNVGTGNFRVGTAAVTATSGFARLVPNQAVSLQTGQALYAIRETVDTTALAAQGA